MEEEEMATWGAFRGTRVMEIVKKHDLGGLVWKRIKLTSTRKANAKKQLHRIWQLGLFLSSDHGGSGSHCFCFMYNQSKMDKSMLGDLDSLPEEDRLRMSSMIDQLQIRDRF